MADKDDVTRRISPDDEGDATQMMRDGEETRMIGDEAPATRRMDAPIADEPAATRRIAPATAAAGPTTEHIAVPLQRETGPWLIAMMVAFGLIVGAVLGYSQSDPSDDNVLTSALVGPKGGVLRFEQRGEVAIPAGALSTATVIKVRKEAVERRVRLGTEGDPNSRVYEAGELDVYAFEPAGLKFLKRIKIVLPKQGEVNGVLVDSDEPRVIAADVKGDVVELRTDNFEDFS